MTPADIIGILEQHFGDKIKAKKPESLDPHIVVDPADLVDVCHFLRDNPRLRFDLLLDISGVDYLEPDAKKAPKAGFEPHVEVVYHLASFQNRAKDDQSRERIIRFTVKVSLPRWKDGKPGELPDVPSLTPLWASANWHEREVYDLVGVWFQGHPDMTRILMSEDWIGHPLRKDYQFPLEYHGMRGR